MAVAAIGQRCESTVGKCQQRRIGAFGRPRAIPRAGHRAHACHLPAGNQPHDVDLVRGLIEHRAAALCGVEFLRTARAIEIIGVVDGIDHPHRAEFAARDQFTQAPDRRIEGMAVADHKMHAGAARRVDDRPRIHRA